MAVPSGTSWVGLNYQLPVDQQIWNALMYFGATPIEAAAIMGNMEQESSLNPEEQVMDSNGAMSRGLVMWNDAGAGAGKNIQQYVTGNVTQDIFDQVQVLAQSGAFALASGSTAAEAAANFMNNFERPASASANENNRTSSATRFYSDAQSNNWDMTPGNAAPAGAGQTLQADTSQGASAAVPAPPPLSNIPELNQYIDQYYPQFAWMLNEPGVASVIDQAIAAGYGGNTAYMQGQIEQTEWWKTTSTAMQQYEETLATNPSALSFLTEGSQAQQLYAQVQAAAATQGVTLTPAQIQGIAQNALQFGWTSQQIDVAIGQDVRYAGAGKTNAGSIADQLGSIAANYYMSPTPQALQSWAENIAAGTQTTQQFQAQMQQDAMLKWTGYANQLQAGNNMVQLTDSLRNNISQLMEVDPSSINFTSGPYSTILDYVAPGDKTGVHRVMTQSEADQYVRSLPQYATTQNARDSAASLEQSLVSTFGKVGS